MYLNQRVSSQSNGKGHDPLINFGSMIQSFQPLGSVGVHFSPYRLRLSLSLSSSLPLYFYLTLCVCLCANKANEKWIQAVAKRGATISHTKAWELNLIYISFSVKQMVFKLGIREKKKNVRK